MSDDFSKTCPACNGTFHGLNPESDAWYCETEDCSVVLFGPRGYYNE